MVWTDGYHFLYYKCRHFLCKSEFIGLNLITLTDYNVV